MSIKLSGLPKAAYGFAALAVASAGLLPALTDATASAAQVQSRSITMSDSTPSATGVTYTVSFKAATLTPNFQGAIVQFCSASPLPEDDCTAPAGMNVASAGVANETPADTWTASVEAGASSAVAVSTATSHSVAAGSTVSFDLTNVTNPSAADTFYARIYTYNTTPTASFTSNNAGTYTDFGGIALSTAADVNVTAKVMESLSFCVFNTACGDSPDITLGHGTKVKALDSSAVDTADVKLTLSTNALNGVNVNIKSPDATYMGVPVSGTNTIAAAGTGATPGAITAGTAAFGMHVTAATATTGTLTKAATYADAVKYGWYGTNIGGTNGDKVLSATAPVNNGSATLTFGATASPTTPSGIYTADEQLIATGKF